jgi:hypothetical protein
MAHWAILPASGGQQSLDRCVGYDRYAERTDAVNFLNRASERGPTNSAAGSEVWANQKAAIAVVQTRAEGGRLASVYGNRIYSWPDAMGDRSQADRMERSVSSSFLLSPQL